MHLFGRVVKPVMTYGADICGYKLSKYKSLYSEIKGDVMEKCHLKYCRFIVGVNERAPILCIYGGTGRFPLVLSTVTSFVQYWYRMSEFNQYKDTRLYNAYMYNMNENSMWWKSVNRLVQIGNTNLDAAARRGSNGAGEYNCTKVQI